MAFGQSEVPMAPSNNLINHHDAPLPDYHDLTSQEQAELRASDRDIFSDDYEAPLPPPTYADSTGNRSDVAYSDIKEKDPSWLVPPPDDSLYGAQPVRSVSEPRPNSPATSVIRSSVEAVPFQRGQVLKITSRGISLIRMPFPSSEIEIPIQREDGTPAYMSVRETKSTGNSILMRSAGVDANGEVDAQLVASTEYNFGPSKDPVVRCLPMGSSGYSRIAAQPPTEKGPTEWQQVWEQGKQGSEVLITGKWTRKTYGFVSPEGRVFEWCYIQEKDAAGKKRINLSLVMLPTQGQYLGKDEKKGKGAEGMRIAQLIRTEETKTAGTSKNPAGNGGDLVLHVDAPKYISEELVVATCLVMLKKEIDRRRLVQFMMVGAAAVIVL